MVLPIPNDNSKGEIQLMTSSHSGCNPFHASTSNEELINSTLSPNDIMIKGVAAGQSLFEMKQYDAAREEFEKWKDESLQAKYQLAVMLYDGLCGDTNYKEAVAHIEAITQDPSARGQEHLVACAFYNLGRAYYEGFGVKQSDLKAEECWLKAAKMESSCAKAQSTLGMFYSRPGEESYNLKEAHFWHQEATGNGSVESQGALGVMYEHGLGVKRCPETAFKCFKNAAERGNVYAMGNLAVHYYRQKLYINAADVSKRVGSLQDVDHLAETSGCLPAYICKGISLGAFIYGRCVHLGLACTKNEREAANWYKRASEFDLNTVAKMQDAMTLGQL